MLDVYKCSITVDGLKSIAHVHRRQMKIFMNLIDEMSATNVSSLHVLAKQYYPNIIA
jgi:hypothetical protein